MGPSRLAFLGHGLENDPFGGFVRGVNAEAVGRVEDRGLVPALLSDPGGEGDEALEGAFWAGRDLLKQPRGRAVPRLGAVVAAELGGGEREIPEGGRVVRRGGGTSEGGGRGDST